MREKLIGIDIGGTSIKIGFLDINGDIIKKWSIETNKENNGSEILNDIWASIKSTLSTAELNDEVVGIGVGAPGFIDDESGLVYKAVNIGWEDFDLKVKLQEISHLPVFVGNDANMATLGENWRGAGNNSDNLIVVTLGTGVGGGIIVNGEVLNGVNGTAGEIGHISVDPDGLLCNCGKKGCLETIVSGTGIKNKALQVIESNPASDLASFYYSNGEITAKDVFSLAKNGSVLSENIIKEITDILGNTLAIVATVINPSKILIGGGLSKAGKPLLDAVRISFKKYALPRIYDSCSLEMAELGNDAGIIGAADFAREGLREK